MDMYQHGRSEYSQSQGKYIYISRKNYILYTFTVVGKNDQYQFTIEAVGGNGCSISLNSNNRAQISYSGTISPLEKEQEAD